MGSAAYLDGKIAHFSNYNHIMFFFSFVHFDVVILLLRVQQPVKVGPLFYV